MNLIRAFLIFTFVLIVKSTELFHYPIGIIQLNRRTVCPKEVEPECYCSCALEKSNMLTPSGDGINRAEFGPFYSKYAEECFGFASKPTCEEADTFVTCFYDQTKNADKELMNECKQQFPVENLNSTNMTAAEFERVENLACFVRCLADNLHMFNEDDTINPSVINPHISFEFDAKKVVQKCETDNKQSGKCAKRANLLMCLVREYESARDNHIATIQTEPTPIN